MDTLSQKTTFFIVLSYLIFIHFFFVLKKNWIAWDATSQYLFNTPLLSKIFSDISTKGYVTQICLFHYWATPSNLGYPLVLTVLGMLFTLFATFLSFSNALLHTFFGGERCLFDLLILNFMMLCFLPHLALMIALRDQSTVFGLELQKQRVFFGIQKTKSHLQADIDKALLEQDLPSLKPEHHPHTQHRL